MINLGKEFDMNADGMCNYFSVFNILSYILVTIN